MTINCHHGANREQGIRQVEGCGKPAVIVILSDQEVWHAGDVQEDILTAYPVCADHAPEEVHEARSSTGGEYEVAHLTLAVLEPESRKGAAS